MHVKSDPNWLGTAILNSLDGFLDWNIHANQVTISLSLKNLLGYSRTELNECGKDFFKDFTHPEDQDHVCLGFQDFFKSLQDVHQSEFRLRAKSGEYVWISLKGRSFRDDLGICHRFAGAVFNIHSYKKEMNKTEEVSSAKSKFIASLNHELRSPLASILSLSHMMLDEDLSAKHKTYMSHIINSSEMLMNLVNDILDISKIDAGKLSLEMRPVHMGDLLDEVETIVRPQYTEKGLFFQVYEDAETPKQLMCDSTRMKQVILNLCTNAIKFTKMGGISIHTRYTPISPQKGKFYMEIVDTGIGIKDDIIDLLFQDFTQADISTFRQYGGTGLGLSICKKIIGLIGGNIAVHSQEGKGSTFWFEIPVNVFLQEHKKSDPTHVQHNFSSFMSNESHR